MGSKRGFLFLFPALLFGCSLDYQSGKLASSRANDTPDTILYNFTTTSVRGKQPYFRIQAAEAETFDKKNITILTKIKFEEYDSDGKIIANGTADRAIYHSDTKNAELSGHLDVYSSQEKAKIETDFLSWNDEKHSLTGEPDVAVSILKDDGSKIQASGFEADLRTRTIRFSSDVQGTFVEKSSK
jgi:LPS export ABC transporter protein LptC